MSGKVVKLPQKALRRRLLYHCGFQTHVAPDAIAGLVACPAQAKRLRCTLQTDVVFALHHHHTFKVATAPPALHTVCCLLLHLNLILRYGFRRYRHNHQSLLLLQDDTQHQVLLILFAGTTRFGLIVGDHPDDLALEFRLLLEPNGDERHLRDFLADRPQLD